MKKRLLSIAVLLALLSTMLSPIVSVLAQDWQIDTDTNTVFVDDANAYLSATPATRNGSGWVEFELISKTYEGEIDVVWGFDESVGVQPSRPQVWADNVAHEMERWIDVEKSGEVTLDGITDYEMLVVGSLEPDIGNSNNTKLIRVNGQRNDIDEGSVVDYSTVIAFNTYTQNSATSATFYYNYTANEKEYYTEYYPDYRDISASIFNKVDHEYLGMDTWYVKRGLSVQKGITYKLRLWVDIPFAGLDKFTTKYCWGAKPNNETIQEAKDSGHLYLLDPWLGDGWDQRIAFVADHDDIDADLVNFPVMVRLSAVAGITGADVTAVFDELLLDANRHKIAITTDDEVTECPVETSYWDDASEVANLFFLAPALSSTVDTTFYLYYDIDHANNPNVGDPNTAIAETVWANGEVFTSHMWDDPDNQHIRDSTSYDNDGTKGAAGGPAEAAPVVMGGNQRFDGNDYINEDVALNDLAATTKGTWMTWIKLDDSTPTVGPFIIAFGDTNAGEYISMVINSAGLGRGDVGVAGVRQWAFNTNAVIGADGIYLHMALIQNGVAPIMVINGVAVAITFTDSTDTTVWFAGCPNLDNGRIGCRNFSGVGNGLFIDEGNTALTKIINTNLTVPWIAATYESEIDNLLTFGAEELVVTPTVVTTDADVTSPVDMTATLNGSITATGGANCIERGFVWDTATHANPGNVAPPATYADSWTEAGSFGVAAFTYLATGLTELNTYYYRAYARGSNGLFVYGNELTFFIGEEDAVYLEFRPDLDETKIRGQAGIPTDAIVGNFNGYSLPIYAQDNEQLEFTFCIPNRWNGESQILVHVDYCLSVGNEADRSNMWGLIWDYATPNEDVIPALPGYESNYQRYIYSNNQYEFYQDWFILDYDVRPLDPIEPDDILTLKLRRETVAPKETDANELIVFAMDILVARGDFMADPEGNVYNWVLTWITNWIDDGTLIGGVSMYFLALLFAAILLMVVAKYTGWSALLFFAACFWMVTGLYARALSTADWDIWYAIFLVSCFGGVLFCVLLATVFRTRPPGEGKHDDIQLSQVERTEKENDDLWEQTRVPRVGRRRSKRKED